MKMYYKTVLIFMSFIVVMGLSACTNRRSNKEETETVVYNNAEKYKVATYPQCSYVTKEMANKIINYFAENEPNVDIANINGVTMNVYKVTSVEWWEYMDAMLNMAPEKYGGKEWEELKNKQQLYLVKCDYGDILSVEKVESDVFDEYEADCEQMDEEMKEYEKNLQDDLDEGMYAGSFSLHGEDPISLVMRNQKTFLYITFIYPNGTKDHGVYDYALNYLTSWKEQIAFEKSTKIE